MEEYGYNTRYMRNFEKQSERALHDTEFMSQFVEGYSNALQEAQEFFTSEGFLKELTKSAFTLGLRAYNLYGLYTNVKDATFYAKNRRWIDVLFDMSKIEFANKFAAKGADIPNWFPKWLKSGITKGVNKIARKELIEVSTGNIIKHSTKTAKTFSLVGSAISIGFGIWDTINGANKIREGSSLSDEFRKVIGPLEEEKDKIIEFWSLINNKP